MKVKAGEKVKVGQASSPWTRQRRRRARGAGGGSREAAAPACRRARGPPRPAARGPAKARADEHRKPQAQREAVDAPARGRDRRAPTSRRGESRISRGAGAAASGSAGRGPPRPAAPSVRRIARELGVDIRQVNGTGPGGRITADDVQAFVRQAIAGGGGGRRRGAGRRSRLPDFCEVGRRRAQADQQHPPQDRRAPATPGTPFRTSRSTTRPTSPRSRSCARSTGRRPSAPAASSPSPPSR